MVTTRLISLFLGTLMFSPVLAHARQPAPLPLFADTTLEGQLNLNMATKEQLMLLPGVGPATAEKIIKYRERRSFQRPGQIMRIKGVGKKTYARLRPFLVLEGETTLHVVRTS